jgi:hypothetical protein
VNRFYKKTGNGNRKERTFNKGEGAVLRPADPLGSLAGTWLYKE